MNLEELQRLQFPHKFWEYLKTKPELHSYLLNRMVSRIGWHVKPEEFQSNTTAEQHLVRRQQAEILRNLMLSDIDEWLLAPIPPQSLDWAAQLAKSARNVIDDFALQIPEEVRQRHQLEDVLTALDMAIETVEAIAKEYEQPRENNP